MFNEIKLPNGLHIVTENIPFVRSIAFGIWVKNGSRNESKDINGISHFIEHMFFKGTKKRSAVEIAEEMDCIGGQLNAYTAKEYTCYYSISLDSHFDKALDILSDMFFNSKFDNDDIKKELNVILEEINMYEDTPEELAYDLLQAEVFNDHSLGYTILGEKDTISNFNTDTLKDYLKKYYRPENTIISIAGNIDSVNATQKVIDCFKNFEASTLSEDTEEVINYNKCLITKEKDIEQAHLILGFPGISINSNETYIQSALNTLFGGGMSSRLFQKIREEHGLCYSVYSYNSSFTDTGIFSIYSGMNPIQIENVITLIKEEIDGIFKNKFTTDQLEKTKEQLKSKYMLSLESSVSRMNSMGKSKLLLNRILDPSVIIDKINSVTLDEMYLLAEKIFKNDLMSIVAVGPINTVDFSRF